MDGLDWIHPFVLFYFLMDGLNEFRPKYVNYTYKSISYRTYLNIAKQYDRPTTVLRIKSNENYYCVWCVSVFRKSQNQKEKEKKIHFVYTLHILYLSFIYPVIVHHLIYCIITTNSNLQIWKFPEKYHTLSSFSLSCFLRK